MSRELQAKQMLRSAVIVLVFSPHPHMTDLEPIPRELCANRLKEFDPEFYRQSGNALKLHHARPHRLGRIGKARNVVNPPAADARTPPVVARLLIRSLYPVSVLAVAKDSPIIGRI